MSMSYLVADAVGATARLRNAAATRTPAIPNAVRSIELLRPPHRGPRYESVLVRPCNHAYRCRCVVRIDGSLGTARGPRRRRCPAPSSIRFLRRPPCIVRAHGARPAGRPRLHACEARGPGREGGRRGRRGLDRGGGAPAKIGGGRGWTAAPEALLPGS